MRLAPLEGELDLAERGVGRGHVGRAQAVPRLRLHALTLQLGNGDHPLANEVCVHRRVQLECAALGALHQETKRTVLGDAVPVPHGDSKRLSTLHQTAREAGQCE